MDFLANKGIGIESCLTSNIQTSTVASLAQHPLKNSSNTVFWLLSIPTTRPYRESK